MMTDKRRRLAALAATAVVLSLAAVACVPVPVQVVTPTVPTQVAPPATPTPTALSPIPGQPPDQEPPLVEVLAPIDEVVILGVDSVPPEISLSVVSGLPNSCARFDRREVVRDGDTIRVTIVNVEPVGAMCADVYGTVTHQIPLDGDFEAGRTYGVEVNDVIEIFVAGAEMQPPASVTAALNRPFRLKLGQSALLEPLGLEVEFLEVVEDSRCPSGVTCVWEGRAIVLFRVSSVDDLLGFGTQELALEVGRVHAGDSSVTGTRATYLFQLLALDPYPQVDAAESGGQQPDYTATLVVSRVEARPKPPVTRTPTSPPPSTPTSTPYSPPPSTNTPTSTPACAVRTDWFAYMVGSGDTLFNIAGRSGISVDALMRANCLTNTSILLGQVLYVPGPIAPLQTPSPQPIWFYLIIPGDNGQSGPPVGCGDSAVAVRSARSATGSAEADIRASLEELFSIRTPNYGQSGYTHSLFAASLAVQSVVLDGRSAEISLSGSLPLVGTCADAQMEAQIRMTVFQYRGFDSALVTLNGASLKQVFDLSGTVGASDPYWR